MNAQARQRGKDSDKRLTVTGVLNGGLASNIRLPKGYEDAMEVRVENEDVEGAKETDIEQDPDGREYTVSTWP